MARSPFQGYIQMLLLLQGSPISYPNRCKPELAQSLGLFLFTAAAQVSRNTTSALMDGLVQTAKQTRLL